MSATVSQARVAVCSRSFSRNENLKAELLQKYPNTKFNSEGKDFTAEELTAFLQGAERAIVGLEKINSDILIKLPDLKIISKYGVGLDSLDLNALRQAQVKLGWTAGVNKRSVSELALGHMLGCLRHLYELNSSVKSGGWNNKIGAQLTEKTIGIVGLGHIGQDLVCLLQAFNVRILANDLLDKSEFANRHNIKMISLEELFSQSDIVTLHVPMNAENHHFVKASLLSKMKSSAILINTARGGLVDETALYTVLSEKKIATAAFDVLEAEPPQNNQLVQLPNFFISPHIGGSTTESTLAMGRAAIDGLATAKPV